MELCQRLGDTDRVECIGIINHDSQTLHVHSTTQDEGLNGDIHITLGHVHFNSCEGIIRPQRYWIASLPASSFEHLQSTLRLRTGFRRFSSKENSSTKGSD